MKNLLVILLSLCSIFAFAEPNNLNIAECKSLRNCYKLAETTPTKISDLDNKTYDCLVSDYKEQSVEDEFNLQIKDGIIQGDIRSNGKVLTESPLEVTSPISSFYGEAKQRTSMLGIRKINNHSIIVEYLLDLDSNTKGIEPLTETIEKDFIAVSYAFCIEK